MPGSAASAVSVSWLAARETFIGSTLTFGERFELLDARRAPRRR